MRVPTCMCVLTNETVVISVAAVESESNRLAGRVRVCKSARRFRWATGVVLVPQYIKTTRCYYIVAHTVGT